MKYFKSIQKLLQKYSEVLDQTRKKSADLSDFRFPCILFMNWFTSDTVFFIISAHTGNALKTIWNELSIIFSRKTLKIMKIQKYENKF